MIEKGQTLVDLVTGGRMTFLETAAETGGDRVVIEFRLPVRDQPARQFESLIETMFSLAADGKTNGKGMRIGQQ